MYIHTRLLLMGLERREIQNAFGSDEANGNKRSEANVVAYTSLIDAYAKKGE